MYVSEKFPNKTSEKKSKIENHQLQL